MVRLRSGLRRVGELALLSWAAACGSERDLGPTGSDGFTIRVELASDVQESAPTTVGIVQWSSVHAGLVEAHIDFGLDTTYGMTAPVNLGHAGFRTLLLGMKPAKTYHFRVVASDGGATYTSDDHTVTTGAPLVPSPLARYSIQLPEQVDQGFFVTTEWSVVPGDLADGWTAFIVDSDGDVVWWYRMPDPGASGEQGFARARLSANAEDMWLVQVSNGGGPVRRVSLDTFDVATFDAAHASHDIAAVSDATMAYIDYGESDCDSIFEIDGSGATKEIFESQDVIGGALRSCHGNSVRYSRKEDVYVYSDDYNDVFVIGRDGTVKWRLTDRVSGGNASWGGHQHGTQLLDDGILIFANRAGGQGHAQALEYGLDGSLIQAFTSRAGGELLGDVQRLPSGNTLIDYSMAGLMQVVSPSDEVVVELAADLRFGYVEFRRSLYGEPLDIDR